MSLSYDTSVIIQKYFPGFFKKFEPWYKLSPSAFNVVDKCPFCFFCRYYSGIEIPQSEAALMGTRCHKMKEVYYSKVNVKKISEMLSENASEDRLERYIFGYFSTAVKGEGEMAAMKGFSKLESKRLLLIKNEFGPGVDKLKLFYLPAFKELDLKVLPFSGRLDCIYRLDYEKYAILDWKDGFSRPWLPEGQEIPLLKQDIIKQMNVYGILVNGSNLMDGNTLVRVGDYFVVYPRYAMVVGDKFSSVITKSLKIKTRMYLDDINDWEFPMHVGEKSCGFHLKGHFTCDYYDVLCSKLIEKLGMKSGEIA